MNLNLLVAFEALFEERSVGRAAARIGLSQPAMSNNLRKLRATFGDALFTRTQSGMLPSARALELAGPVREGLSRIRSALEQSAGFAPQRSTRRFNLAMTDYAELLVVGPLLRRLAPEAPGMQLAVRRPERIFITPEESLRTGRLDLALGFFPAANELDRSLRSADLLQEENVCIGSERNPLLRAKRLSVQSFARAGHVGIFYAPERRGLVDELLKPLGVQRRLAATTSHLMIAPYLVAGSDLLAVVPAGLAQRFCRPLRLAIRQLPFSMPPFHLRMVWHERADEDAAHAWLRSLILDVFSGRSHAPSAASVGGARRG